MSLVVNELCLCARVVRFMKTYTLVAPNLACGKARGASALALSIPRSGSVTDEQRSHRPNSAQPCGRQFFFGQTSLLAPHRPMTGMLVVRASSGQKISCRECMGFHETDY